LPAYRESLRNSLNFAIIKKNLSIPEISSLGPNKVDLEARGATKMPHILLIIVQLRPTIKKWFRMDFV
jgi:hypothetical protein